MVYTMVCSLGVSLVLFTEHKRSDVLTQGQRYNR